MEVDQGPGAAHPPPKRARREEEGDPSTQAPPDQPQSQRMLCEAANLRRQAAEVQREAEASAAAAAERRGAAERLLEGARLQVAAAEQRARQDGQQVLQRAQASIQVAAAAAAVEGSPVEAALAVDALAKVEQQVQQHVVAARARAEVAYGETKARTIIAAAEAEAAAALAGWPAEQRRLLDRASRLELQAPLVAELEAQQGSALVQQLATSGCLPLIAACLGDGADKWVQGRVGEGSRH